MLMRAHKQVNSKKYFKILVSAYELRSTHDDDWHPNGKKRWKGVSPEARLESGKRLAEVRIAATTPEQRKAIAKKAAAARWNTKKKAGAKKAKKSNG